MLKLFFSDVDKDFSAKIPKIFFAIEGFKCELSLNNHMAVQTTKLLRDYMCLDPRVHTLAVVIRGCSTAALLKYLLRQSNYHMSES